MTAEQGNTGKTPILALADGGKSSSCMYPTLAIHDGNPILHDTRPSPVLPLCPGLRL